MVLFRKKCLEWLWQNKKFCCKSLSFLLHFFLNDSHIFTAESCSFDLVFVESEVCHSQINREESLKSYNMNVFLNNTSHLSLIRHVNGAWLKVFSSLFSFLLYPQEFRVDSLFFEVPLHSAITYFSAIKEMGLHYLDARSCLLWRHEVVKSAIASSVMNVYSWTF